MKTCTESELISVCCEKLEKADLARYFVRGLSVVTKEALMDISRIMGFKISNYPYQTEISTDDYSSAMTEWHSVLDGVASVPKVAEAPRKSIAEELALTCWADVHIEIKEDGVVFSHVSDLEADKVRVVRVGEGLSQMNVDFAKQFSLGGRVDLRENKGIHSKAHSPNLHFRDVTGLKGPLFTISPKSNYMTTMATIE